MSSKPPEVSVVRETIIQHFDGCTAEMLVTTTRVYPPASRIDLQLALDQFFVEREAPRLFEIIGSRGPFDSLMLADLFSRGWFDIGPLQTDDVDIGSGQHVRCPKNALWLSVAEHCDI